MQETRRVFLIPLVGVAFVGLIVAILLRPLAPVVEERTRSHWFARAPGNVLECNVLTNDDLPVLRLAYQYRYAGRELHNENWRVPPLFVQRADYDALCARLKPGSAVDVYVDPRHPETATLEQGFSGQDILSLLLFLACLSLLAAFGWASLTGTAPGQRNQTLVTTIGQQVRIYRSMVVGGMTLRLLIPELWCVVAILGLVFGKEPSFRTIEVALACLALLALATYLAERRRFARGTKAILIDRSARDITSAKALGQPRHTFSIDDIRTLAILPVRWVRENDSGVIYAVGAFARSQADEVCVLHQQLNLDEALEVAQLLVREINGLRPERPISAPTEPLKLEPKEVFT